MAFGPVAMGSMKPRLAAIDTGNTSSSGFTPMAAAKAATIGSMAVSVATLDMASSAIEDDSCEEEDDEDDEETPEAEVNVTFFDDNDDDDEDEEEELEAEQAATTDDESVLEMAIPQRQQVSKAKSWQNFKFDR